MGRSFTDILSGIRHEKGISQRRAAADLHISQALLSHYENGAREPGLMFVCRACDYYGVSADYLLGRGTEPLVGSSDGALSALHAALSERDDPELSAAAERYIQAAVRRLCDEIYGVADARSMSRQSLEMAEAERAIAERSPDKRHTGRFSDK